MQNGYIERFNRLYREAVLDAYLFFELQEVRILTREWIEEYNTKRPHESLQNHTPEEWKLKQNYTFNTLIKAVWEKGYLQDRFSRNAGDAYAMINQLNKLGVEP